MATKFYKRESKSTQSTIAEVIKISDLKVEIIQRSIANKLSIGYEYITFKKFVDQPVPKNYEFITKNSAIPATESEFNKFNQNFTQ